MFHPAEGAPVGRSVLVAPPLLNEAMRAHYALRQIAIKLAAAGIDVLRFDYTGTGNSLLDAADVPPHGWVSDFRSATAELAELSGTDRVAVFAARFSACIAAQAAPAGGYERVATWEPVLSGADWYESLRESQHRAIKRLPNVPIDNEREFLGHMVHEEFVSELLAARHGHPAADRVLHIVCSPDAAKSIKVADAEIVNVGFSCEWESLSSQVLYPHEVINQACQFLT